MKIELKKLHPTHFSLYTHFIVNQGLYEGRKQAKMNLNFRFF